MKPEDINEPIVEAIKDAKPPQFPDLDEIYEKLQRAAHLNTHHTPRQEGPYLVCISCSHHHTLKYIGTGKILVGVTPEGEPMLKDR